MSHHDRNRKKVDALLAVPENTKCADCNDNKPKMASVTFGVFLCHRCATLHKRLHGDLSVVKGVRDAWTDDDVRAVTLLGNRKANNLFLAESTERLPQPASSDQVLFEHIKDKYQRRKWMKEKDRNAWDARGAGSLSSASASASNSNSNSTDEDKRLYSSQIQQLGGMGFKNTKNCIIALKKCNGNVEAAVEVLISMPDSTEAASPASKPTAPKASPPSATQAAPTTSTNNQDVKKTIREALDFFNGMGFTDELENMKAFKEANGDVDAAVNILMSLQASKPAPQPQNTNTQPYSSAINASGVNQSNPSSNNTFGMDLLSLNDQFGGQNHFVANQQSNNQPPTYQQAFLQQSQQPLQQFQTPQQQQQQFQQLQQPQPQQFTPQQLNSISSQPGSMAPLQPLQQGQLQQQNTQSSGFNPFDSAQSSVLQPQLQQPGLWNSPILQNTTLQPQPAQAKPFNPFESTTTTLSQSPAMSMTNQSPFGAQASQQSIGQQQPNALGDLSSGNQWNAVNQHQPQQQPRQQQTQQPAAPSQNSWMQQPNVTPSSALATSSMAPQQINNNAWMQPIPSNPIQQQQQPTSTFQTQQSLPSIQSTAAQQNPFGIQDTSSSQQQQASSNPAPSGNKDSIMSLFNAPRPVQPMQTVFVPVTMVAPMGGMQQPGMVMMQPQGMGFTQQAQQQQTGQQQPGMYSTFTSSSQNSPLIPRSQNQQQQQAPVVNGQFAQQQRNLNPFA
ncbi:hypothetical protein BDR26DRAFT_845968 [Obelidium mucronatum]|nr:hypothetical protein BDR26DRAFT_845968 [Obelidium mucronatum]